MEREAALSARAEAERASRAKTEFLAVVSHELRTPLNAILGYEELLETEVAGPMSDVQKHHLARIRESTRHLLALIEQILSLSRTQSGKEDVRMETVDAAALAREAVALLAPQIQRKGLVLDLALPEGAVGLRTDPRKVRQILLNLLSNAVKFTDSGAVTLELARSDGSLSFRIRDTGRGISDLEKERIFEPFYQIQGEGRVSSGTGLGLPVARELARHLGGDVILETHHGEGSTFTVHLPDEDLGERVATEAEWDEVGEVGAAPAGGLSRPPRPT
jgi:signal transduction histidine kinase